MDPSIDPSTVGAVQLAQEENEQAITSKLDHVTNLLKVLASLLRTGIRIQE